MRHPCVHGLYLKSSCLTEMKRNGIPEGLHNLRQSKFFDNLEVPGSSHCSTLIDYDAVRRVCEVYSTVTKRGLVKK